MFSLKQIRVILSLIFLGEAIAFVALGVTAPSHSLVAFRLQIVPSLLAGAMGATLTWFVGTLMLGRVYCSTVCPIGTLQDIATYTRQKIFRRKIVHSYKPGRPVRYAILTAYISLTILGSAVATLLEPWRWFAGFITAASPAHEVGVFAVVTSNVVLGIVIAALAFILLMVYAVLTGRDFCNHICPIGTALGIISTRAALHIEIDPDRCISCLKCEDGCKSSCISVKDRLVDNARCVRCFNCIEGCPNNAIRLQINRNGVMSPMLRRATHTSPNL